MHNRKQMSEPNVISISISFQLAKLLCAMDVRSCARICGALTNEAALLPFCLALLSGLSLGQEEWSAYFA
jgi:hypothetical protein